VHPKNEVAAPVERLRSFHVFNHELCSSKSHFLQNTVFIICLRASKNTAGAPPHELDVVFAKAKWSFLGNLSAVWATKTHRDTAVKTYSDLARKVQKKRSVKTQTKKVITPPHPRISSECVQEKILQRSIKCLGKCKTRSYNVRSSRNTPT
jgi:hypothetical protein